MLAPQTQRGIGLPLVGVIQGSLSRVGLNVPHYLRPAVGCDRQNLDLAIAFDDPEDDHLAFGAPTLLVMPSTAESGFGAFKRSLKRLSKLFRPGHAGSNQAMKPFRSRGTGKAVKPLPVDRYAPDETLEQLMLGRITQPAGRPDTLPAVALTAALALAAASANS